MQLFTLEFVNFSSRPGVQFCFVRVLRTSFIIMCFVSLCDDGFSEYRSVRRLFERCIAE